MKSFTTPSAKASSTRKTKSAPYGISISLGRHSFLEVNYPRFKRPKCAKTFNPSLPVILPGKQSSEPFRKHVAKLHHEGIPSSAMAKMARIGTATVERIYQQFNRCKAAERISLQCPQILGIDEHTIHKKKGRFATTFLPPSEQSEKEVELKNGPKK